MNNARRKEITSLIDRLTTLRSTLDEIATDIENVRDEEQDYLDNMPENLQGSERYETAEQAVNSLDEAKDAVDTMLSSLDEAEQAMESARDGA